MKIHQYIKMLATGLIGLSLVSCGGGGGSGGDSSSPSSGNEPSEENPETVEYAPDKLNTGASFTLEINGENQTYNVTSPTECVNASNGKVYGLEYTRTGSKAATLKITEAGGSSIIHTLTFIKPNQGNMQIENGTITCHGSFSFNTGSSDSDNNDSGTSGDNDTPGDSSGEITTPGYAPSALPSNQHLVIKKPDGSDIAFKILSANSAELENVTGSIKYEVVSANSAVFEFSGSSATHKYTLEFNSPTTGMADNKTTGGQTSFRIGEYIAPTPPSSDSSGDTPDGETNPDAGTGSGDSTTTPPSSDNSGNTGAGSTPAPAPTPEYLAPSGLKGLKIRGYGREYYYFIYDGAMEYSDGYTLFTGASCTYKRTGYTTGTLTFRYAHSYTGSPYYRTQKTRESSNTINLTFYKGPDGKLRVRMEGRVRETTRTEDLTEWPANTTTNSRTFSITGEYKVE